MSDYFQASSGTSRPTESMRLSRLSAACRRAFKKFGGAERNLALAPLGRSGIFFETLEPRFLLSADLAPAASALPPDPPADSYQPSSSESSTPTIYFCGTYLVSFPPVIGEDGREGDVWLLGPEPEDIVTSGVDASASEDDPDAWLGDAQDGDAAVTAEVYDETGGPDIDASSDVVMDLLGESEIGMEETLPGEVAMDEEPLILGDTLIDAELLSLGAEDTAMDIDRSAGSEIPLPFERTIGVAEDGQPEEDSEPVIADEEAGDPPVLALEESPEDDAGGLSQSEENTPDTDAITDEELVTLGDPKWLANATGDVVYCQGSEILFSKGEDANLSDEAGQPLVYASAAELPLRNVSSALPAADAAEASAEPGQAVIQPQPDAPPTSTAPLANAAFTATTDAMTLAPVIDFTGSFSLPTVVSEAMAGQGQHKAWLANTLGGQTRQVSANAGLKVTVPLLTASR